MAKLKQNLKRKEQQNLKRQKLMKVVEKIKPTRSHRSILIMEMKQL
jgi:hypothetical protein